MTETDFQPDLQNDQADDIYEDYFGFEERRKWYLPDGKQYIEFKLMTEGERGYYQSKTSKDVRLFRQSGDASIKVDPTEDRKILMECSVVGWNLMRKVDGQWQPVAFPTDIKRGGANNAFTQWLRGANPKLISDLEMTIRKANPWMQSDMTVTQVEEEIAELEKLRADLLKRDEGKDS